MANQKIRGITIELGADTSEFSQAMRNVDSSISNTSRSLKDINKLLKLDPKNVELLTQKQQQLSKIIDETSARLEILREAQSKMDENGIDKNSDQYQALQREIFATQQKLSGYQTQLENVKNADKELDEAQEEASESARQFGADEKALADGMKTVGDAVQNASSKLIEFGKSTITAFTEVDNSYDTIIAKTGATGDSLTELTDIADNIATTLPVSFDSVGTAIGEVNTRFKLTGNELEGLSTDFLKFAQINGVDVNNAIDQTQKALSGFGLGSESASALLDRLNKVGQNTGASMDGLLSGLIRNSTAFKELGLDIDQSVTLIGQLEVSGANSETVMNGLRKALQNATKDGKPFNQALKELQEGILNGTEGMDGLTLAYDMFGKSGDQIYGAIKSGTLDFSTLGETVEDVGGSVSDTFDAMLDPTDQFTVASNSAKLMMSSLGETVQASLLPVLTTLTNTLKSVTEWWSNLDEDTKGVIVTVGEMVIIIGTAIGVGMKVISIVQTLQGILPVLNEIMSANPIGVIIVAVTTLITLLVTLYNNCEGFRNFVNGAVESIKNWLVDAWSTVKNVWSQASGFFSGLFDNIKNTFAKVTDAIKKPFQNAWDGIKKLFSGEISLPKIKLPHFSVSGSLNPLNWLSNGLPSISVQWYGKAMNQPYTFNSPTLIGVGERGSETVVGTEWLKNHTGNTVNISMTVNGAEGQNVTELADLVADRINMTMKQSEAW